MLRLPPLTGHQYVGDREEGLDVRGELGSGRGALGVDSVVAIDVLRHVDRGQRCAQGTDTRPHRIAQDSLRYSGRLWVSVPGRGPPAS